MSAEFEGLDDEALTAWSGPSAAEAVRFEVRAEHAAQRLDRVLAETLPHLSRSRLTQLIKSGAVRLNGAEARPSRGLCAGDLIELRLPAEPSPVPQPEPMPLDVLFEDAHLIVLNKPAGLVVHPGAGHAAGTLVHGLLHRFARLSAVGPPDRPGIVHRLDAGTSGLLAVARTDESHRHLAAQFASRQVLRRYLALVWDRDLPDRGLLQSPYGRHPQQRTKMSGQVHSERLALTEWRVAARRPPFALVWAQLHTGRTHQIRVHLAQLGCPIVGDPLYGERRRVAAPPAWRQRGVELGMTRPSLHAAQLGLRHPQTDRWMTWSCPLPDDLRARLAWLDLTEPAPLPSAPGERLCPDRGALP